MPRPNSPSPRGSATSSSRESAAQAQGTRQEEQKITITDSTESGLTQKEMILVAFHRASKGSISRVPYEDLVVAAWKEFPNAFSLRNYPQYPDASDIHKRLSELGKSGYIVPLGNKVFRLTDSGIAEAAKVFEKRSGDDAKVKEAGVRLARVEAAFYSHALQSRAFATWQAGHKEKLVDFDARLFFKFSTNTTITERKRRVEAALLALSNAQKSGMKDAAELHRLSEYLVEQFETLFKEV